MEKKKKKITVETRKTSQIHFLQLPGVSSVTDTQHHREPIQIPAGLYYLKPVPYQGLAVQSWLHHTSEKE